MQHQVEGGVIISPTLLLVIAAALCGGCGGARNDVAATDLGSSSSHLNGTGESVTIPVGYKDYDISLGDHLDSVKAKIQLVYSYESRYGNATGGTDTDTSAYFNVSEPLVQVGTHGTLNPSLSLVFDERKRLIKFSLTYTVDAYDIDIKPALVKFLGDSILPRIQEWRSDTNVQEVRNSNHKYRFKLDTNAGAFPHMHYEIAEVINPGE